ncbi:MAG: peptide deformylase [Candidatus Kerfeldbacteria bacterium]|nr:peptide deformylase [Candidatus Kerfeldbacteria bacterium]
MAVRTITTLGAPILRQVAQPVDLTTVASPTFQNLLHDMVETMIAAQGIGLAAPQINVSLQVAIINGQAGPYAIINPRLQKSSRQTELAEEGCLSIPDVFGTVRRPARVTVTYDDEQGRPQSTAATGLLARVMQHEIDHLNGVLFIDKVQQITQGQLP